MKPLLNPGSIAGCGARRYCGPAKRMSFAHWGIRCGHRQNGRQIKTQRTGSF